MMIRLALVPLTLTLAAPLWADTPPDAPAPPPPPIREPLPPKVLDPDAQLEPEVTIRREEGQVIEEYAIAGQVYMIRIVPAVGPPFYLIDTTGDGNFDSRHEHMEPVRPAHWKIFEW